MKWLQKVRKRMYNKNIFLNFERSHFFNEKNFRRKLKMCKEHVEEGKSLSHVCELHEYKNIDKLKYAVNLYKRYGEKPFLNREQNVIEEILNYLQ